MNPEEDNFEYEESAEGSDDYAVTPDDFKELFVIPSDWIVATLKSSLGSIIDLEPDFQRRGVWSQKAKSKFIESLALGIPIPQILLAESKDRRGEYLVLDGKQRLLAMQEFFGVDNTEMKTFSIEGLTDLKELNGLTWLDVQKQIPQVARAIDTATIRTVVIRGWSNDNVLYEIFHRLNSGSVGLSPMELRMALVRGPFVRSLIKEASYPSAIHRLLNLTTPDKRMKDVEIVLRYLAFSDGRVQYRGNLKDFLDDYCRLKNKEFRFEDLRANLEKLDTVVSVGLDVFPSNTFGHKYIPTQDRFEGVLNRAVLDVLVASLTVEPLSKQVLQSPSEFVDLFKSACSDPKFMKSVESTTKSVEATNTRFRIWYELIKRAYGIEIKMPNIVNASK